VEFVGLDQTEHVLDVSRHVGHRQSALSLFPHLRDQFAGILAANARRHHRHRLGADVLTELEKFVKSQADALMITQMSRWPLRFSTGPMVFCHW
jgi:hypothetical protein